MTCSIHCKKVIQGGLAAGVWFNLCDFVGHGMILMKRYAALGDMGHLYKEPVLPFLPLNLAMNFGLAMLATWIYASSRDTLGPGPKTALKIGALLGLIAATPDALVNLSWSPIGKFVPFVSFLTAMAQYKIGTLIGASIYKPRA